MDWITSYLLTLILKTLGRNSTACFYQDAPSKNMLSVGKHILRGSPKVISRYLISPTPLFHLTVSSKNVILCNRSWSGMAVAVAGSAFGLRYTPSLLYSVLAAAAGCSSLSAYSPSKPYCRGLLTHPADTENIVILFGSVNDKSNVSWSKTTPYYVSKK